MPSARDAQKALRLLQAPVSKSAPRSATGRADTSNTRIGLSQHQRSGTAARADDGAEDKDNGPPKHPNGEEKVVNKAERLMALFRSNAHAKASPAVELPREKESGTEDGRNLVTKREMLFQKHGVFALYKYMVDDDPSSKTETQVEPPKATAQSHTLMSEVDTRIPLRKVELAETRRVRIYGAKVPSPPTQKSRPKISRAKPSIPLPPLRRRIRRGASRPRTKFVKTEHPEESAALRYHEAKGQNIHVQYHGRKTVDIRYEGTAINYHGVKNSKVSSRAAKDLNGQNSANSSGKVGVDKPNFRTFPAFEGPAGSEGARVRDLMKFTLPKGDVFLLEDFKPILKMLCDATPDIPINRDSAQTDADGEYWQDSESDANSTMDGVGELMNDITYAPPTEAVRIRTTWAGTREYSLSSSNSISSSASRRRPTQWTQQSLADYFGNLSASAARAAERYPTGISANKYRIAVAEEITALLIDEAMVPHITPATLNMALLHLCNAKANEDVLRIYRYLKGQSFSFSSNGFNTILYAAAWEERPSDFRPVLEHMLDSGFQPTGQTWFTFYQLTARKYPKERRHVLFAMREKGLLQQRNLNIKASLIAALGWTDQSESVIRSAAQRRLARRPTSMRSLDHEITNQQPEQPRRSSSVRFKTVGRKGFTRVQSVDVKAVGKTRIGMREGFRRPRINRVCMTRRKLRRRDEKTSLQNTASDGQT